MPWVLQHGGMVDYKSYISTYHSDLERVQQSAVKVILKDEYKGYKNGLAQLGIEDLKSRRENLCLEFAKKCVKSTKLQYMFPKTKRNIK